MATPGGWLSKKSGTKRTRPEARGAALLLALCALVTTPLASCAASSAGGTAVALGNWGGKGVDLLVGEQSTRFEFDCAHGEIEGRLAVADSGEAEAAGWIVHEGGPTREEETRVEARFRLRLEGARLYLTLVSATPGSSHRFEAVRNQAAILRKCG